MKFTSKRKGFTLVEVLLVIVVIAILAGIVIVAINPARQIAQANNTQRDADVKAILDAVHEYAIDNRGAYPSGISSSAVTMGSATAANVCSALVPIYIAEMPYDPTASGASYSDCSDYNTGYNISQTADGRITVSAPGAELSETISVTR